MVDLPHSGGRSKTNDLALARVHMQINRQLDRANRFGETRQRGADDGLKYLRNAREIAFWAIGFRAKTVGPKLPGRNDGFVFSSFTSGTKATHGICSSDSNCFAVRKTRSIRSRSRPIPNPRAMPPAGSMRERGQISVCFSSAAGKRSKLCALRYRKRGLLRRSHILLQKAVIELAGPIGGTVKSRERYLSLASRTRLCDGVCQLSFYFFLALLRDLVVIFGCFSGCRNSSNREFRISCIRLRKLTTARWSFPVAD